MDYEIEWDDNKNSLTIQKHGISFEIAQFVFLDKNHIILYDDVHSIEEDRYIAIGKVEDVLFVVIR